MSLKILPFALYTNPLSVQAFQSRAPLYYASYDTTAVVSRVYCRENMFIGRSLATAISSGSTVLVSALMSQYTHIRVYSSFLNSFIHDLFYDTIRSSDFVVANGRMISEG
jgi:hypothetical protein